MTQNEINHKLLECLSRLAAEVRRIKQGASFSEIKGVEKEIKKLEDDMVVFRP